ncbi:hypothetical protein [Deinococcus multiflagellatus]|uniref:DUF4197 domain-containing protein n=1 Tax=Deinococcus multiflagellatus TaxID=1656887 RepID=A0ABW1ZKX8_9DEIO|nr:hypothetical protein [Deinococcus multiflagellatus]MBZ9713683.1 hypothetical protein [Deinococcus multiflagellatus]
MALSRALALLLASSLLSAPVAAQTGPTLPPRPGTPSSPAGVTAAQLQVALNERPVLRLMLLNLSLREVLRTGTVKLTPNTQLKVRILLAPLSSNATLQPDAAQQTVNNLLQALTPEQRRAVESNMQSREDRARMLASQTRIVGTAGPVSGVQAVLYLLIPGGRSVVDRLNRQDDLNPYRINAANTDILNSLLDLLK